MNSHAHLSLVNRRDFLGRGAQLAAAGIFHSALGETTPPAKRTSETLVTQLHASLNDDQKKKIVFPWSNPLRQKVDNNWHITKQPIREVLNKDQQDLVRQIFDGLHSDEYKAEVWRQFDQDNKSDGGFPSASIGLFGEPGSGKFEFVLASRHMTLRCDGDSAAHVAFGGPILYAHEGDDLHEKPHHPHNVFWHQAVEANKLYHMLDGKHRAQALVIKGMPTEELVGFKGRDGKFQGCPVSLFSKDQKAELQRILNLMLEPFRTSDRDEVVKCLAAQGGLDGCFLAFYKEGDLGDDGIYDNWRLEGPSFVWYFRGRPHVHVWVNIADDSSPKLNSFQNSIM